MPTVSVYEISRLLEEIEKRFRAGKVDEARYLFKHTAVEPPNPIQDSACAAYTRIQYDNLKALLFPVESNRP